MATTVKQFIEKCKAFTINNNNVIKKVKTVKVSIWDFATFIYILLDITVQ